jgi:hypothetical protein
MEDTSIEQIAFSHGGSESLGTRSVLWSRRNTLARRTCPFFQLACEVIDWISGEQLSRCLLRNFSPVHPSTGVQEVVAVSKYELTIINRRKEFGITANVYKSVSKNRNGLGVAAYTEVHRWILKMTTSQMSALRVYDNNTQFLHPSEERL